MSTGKDWPQDDNVLTLAERAYTSVKIDKIESYWNEVRGQRLVPSRCEIDPRGLGSVLSHAFILERIAGGLARFRIAGSHLADVTGLELRQMPISALFLPGSREQLSDAMEAVFDEPAMVRMRITSPGGFGRPALEGELVLLPLRSDLGDVDRVLGGLVFHGRIGRTPRRIEIVNQSRKTLTGYAGPSHGRDVPNKDMPSGDHAPSSVSRAAPALPKPSSRSYLKLVVSNE
ncbi:MAG: PAS domain-containing protein [Pseudomonadota bacterium]